jgi:DNA-binding MarR family transcriptional regulator
MKQQSEQTEIPVLNIRTLTYFLSQMMDHRIDELRAGSPFAHLRASDLRVFVAAARNNRTMSDIARLMHITRQSVQSSVQRLEEIGVVELVAIQGNRRDKLVHLTRRGTSARGLAVKVLAIIDQEFNAILGQDEYAQLKTTMLKLIAAYRGGEFLPRRQA